MNKLKNNDTEDLCHIRCIHQERVAAAKNKELPPKELEDLAQLFKALGDPNRLRILLALAHDEMCVCDIAAFLTVSESAVSHQLRLLRQMRLVTNRRDGAVLYYRLREKSLRKVISVAENFLGSVP